LRGILSQHDSRRSIWVAGLAAGLVVLVIATIAPSERRPLPMVPAFLPMFATTVFLINGLTAYFLAIQFRSSREPFLGALAGAYGFVMVMACAQLLTFPGALAGPGLLRAGAQGTAWIWMLWHAGFPVCILAALSVQALCLAAGGGEWLNRLSTGLMFGGPLAAVAASWAVVAGQAHLPHLIHGNDYTGHANLPAGAVVLGTNLLAILACLRVTRLRDLLSLWVAVAMLTSLGNALLMLSAGSRYTLGWYAGQVLSVAASSAVLCVLIYEFDRLYDQLLAASAGLAERALHDGLTGAFNRGYFDELIPRELRRAQREQAPLSLLLLDVDHFKSYNDIRGHQRGDECLVAMVGAIRRVIRRPADFIARYGGEEFAIVLPGAGGAGAVQIAEAVRAEILALGLAHGDSSLGRVTVSLGVATFDPACDNFDDAELVRRADLALYQAKHAGRDMARLFQPQPATV
jgi:diguanylate cyclase (GGDEF)-like protein